MIGNWNVQLADGTHTVNADLNWWMQWLTVTFDGTRVGSWFIPIMLGKIRTFQQNGHAFELHVKGLGPTGHLTLRVDGAEVDASGAPVPAAPAKAPAAAQASSAPAAPAPPALQFVKELSAAETDEVLGIEEYPLDNSFGDAPLSTDRQVSKTSTNDFSIQLTDETSGKVGMTLFSLLNADIAKRVCRAIGHTVGESVTESQTLHMQVKEQGAVLYRVIWKRKVRTGEQLYLAGGEPITVPYRMNYGLSCEIRTSALTRDPG